MGPELQSTILTFKYCGFPSLWQKYNNISSVPNYKKIDTNEERYNWYPQREVHVFKENSINGYNNKVTSIQRNMQVKQNWNNSGDSSNYKAITLAFFLMILVTSNDFSSKKKSPKLPRPYDRGCMMKQAMSIYYTVR